MLLLALFALAAAAQWAPVQEFNVHQYLGHWVQAYSDLAVIATFENASTCVSADYGMNENGTVSVWNRERQYSVDGPERQIFGWAAATNSSAPGELTVHLQGTGGFGAPYWIYELGPVEEEQYTYSVVSDPFRLTLFILARNLTTFAAQWSAGVLARLMAAGYSGVLNTPIATVQEGCLPVNMTA
jgi:apolipoprotein D and lipocalin family protein